MKKLNLKLNGIKEKMLNREQMKMISGGYGGGPCYCHCDFSEYTWSNCDGNIAGFSKDCKNMSGFYPGPYTCVV